jgi:hypothetical protein
LARTAKDDFQNSQASAPCKPVTATDTDTATTDQTPWRGVFFDGPEPEQDRDGEEIPVWTVYVGDENANPLSRVYRVFSFAKAQSLANAMSHDRQLELIAEAMPADAKPQVAEPVAA